MKKSNLNINQIIDEVKARYPFPEIIVESADAMRGLASVLENLAPQGGRLLDIGCGALDKTIVFQGMGFECFACDDFRDPWHSKSTNLDPVLECARKEGVQVHPQDDDYTIPWERESFDVVTVLNVIEHLYESPREILNTGGRFLKTGGLILVAMPNSVNLRKRLSVLRGQTNYTPLEGFYEFDGPWRGHIREFTFEETRQIVEWTGFETVYKNTFHGMAGRRLRNPLIRTIFKGLCMARPSFRDSILVAARKPEGWSPRQPNSEAMQKSLTASWVGH